MTDSIRVRLATLADLPAILATERTCATAAHWSEEQYQAVLQSASRTVLVYEDRGCEEQNPGAETQSFGELTARLKSCCSQNPSAVVAFLVANSSGPEWELENVVVAPSRQRSGVGSGLMRELISRAAAAGGESIFLEVRESNAGARKLYERCGFAEAGRRPQYYSNPGEDAIVYRLQLSEERSQNETKPG